MRGLVRKPPAQKPGRSKQDYGTPRELIDAVQRRFGVISVDLAANEKNRVCSRFIDERANSLSVGWRTFGGLAWLNPPFANIAPWAEKCAAESGPNLRILLLVPASVGSNWFADHVHQKAIVLALAPRITFVGETKPYIKDIVLCCYGFGASGFDLWRWKNGKTLKAMPVAAE